MRRCDVLVVGGGPAGSTCAWALRRAGADVVILDRAEFPRDKVCAGWITPAVLSALRLTADEYRAAGLVIQELRAFRTSCADAAPIETRYGSVVSYAIRRCEFDTFLVRRSGAELVQKSPLASLERTGSVWVANGSIAAPVVVGAGGHFCPVAQRVGSKAKNGVVVAREIEIALGPDDRCDIAPGVPELFFSRDLEGYGWVLRKGNYLNIGIGRRTSERFADHVDAFSAMLRSRRRVPSDAARWRRWRGHAYLLARAMRAAAADGLLLVGDAAGVASAESGEGIGPAVESGILAANAIVTAAGRYTEAGLRPYSDALHARFGEVTTADRLRAKLPAAVGRALLRSPRFTRHVLDEWFLRPQITATLPAA